MRGQQNHQPAPTPEAPPKRRQLTKKAQILSLHAADIQDVAELAMLTRSRPSYVAKVLQDAGHLQGYFDLYTGSSQPMNVYSRYFRGRLGFKDKETARRSIDFIDQMYEEFAKVRDRAGQHHALQTALVLWNRARWSGHQPEAEIYRAWLVKKLRSHDEEIDGPTAQASRVPDKAALH